MVAGLTTGLKVSPQSTPTCWDLPSHTSRALYRSSVPSAFFLCLKIHMLRTIFMSGLFGTNSQVLLAISARNSSVMAFFQFGSERASVGDFGSGEREGVVVM
ncbi:hypothetical protein HanIR_Chr06g0260531 [Helianthus annuus]|nr:hypothetical protein HanIR_Chr06g0260531 [Helianthus annuus]